MSSARRRRSSDDDAAGRRDGAAPRFDAVDVICWCLAAWIAFVYLYFVTVATAGL